MSIVETEILPIALPENDTRHNSKKRRNSRKQRKTLRINHNKNANLQLFYAKSYNDFLNTDLNKYSKNLYGVKTRRIFINIDIYRKILNKSSLINLNKFNGGQVLSCEENVDELQFSRDILSELRDIHRRVLDLERHSAQLINQNDELRNRLAVSELRATELAQQNSELADRFEAVEAELAGNRIRVENDSPAANTRTVGRPSAKRSTGPEGADSAINKRRAAPRSSLTAAHIEPTEKNGCVKKLAGSDTTITYHQDQRPQWVDRAKLGNPDITPPEFIALHYADLIAQNALTKSAISKDSALNAALWRWEKDHPQEDMGFSFIKHADLTARQVAERYGPGAEAYLVEERRAARDRWNQRQALPTSAPAGP